MAFLYPDEVAAVRAKAKARDVPALADELIHVADINDGHWGHDGRRVTDALDALDESGKHELVAALIERASGITAPGHRASVHTLVTVVGRTFGAGLPPDVAETMLQDAAKHHTYWPATQLRTYAEAVVGDGRRLSPEAVAVIRRTAYGARWQGEDLKKYAKTLTEPVLNRGEAWADAVIADLPALGGAWAKLVAHAATATAARPSETWNKKAVALLADIPDEQAGDTVRRWLSLVGRPRTWPLERGEYEHEVNESYDLFNSVALRGLVWLTVHLPEHPDTARVLGGLVETSLRKVAGLGPRSPKTANAAVLALAGLGTGAALAQLARLITKVTYKGTVKELDAALEAMARSLNLSRDEVEELAVPTYGFAEVGRRVVEFGSGDDRAATAVVSVQGGRATLTWSNSTGRTVKAPPAAVRTDHAEDLKELKATVKDLDQMLSAQAERLDRQFLAQRVWPFAAWRERYLDHALVGTLARRLIWVVDGTPVAFVDGALRTLDGSAVDDGGSVELWHPIGRPVEEVVAWREFLERHGITQPFKQAHREVYLLTAAEERTRTYSNRFAAHILRQHQFHALAAVRGWSNRLRLMVDDTYPPATRTLPGWGLRAEFWVEGVGEEYGEDTTEAGAYLRLATDQVRFYRHGAPENTAHAGGGGYEQYRYVENALDDPVPLADVPPLVLSEVMRDVDLFVGVASVGNDPTWQDGGPRGRFRDYWAEYSFGELSGTAETRRDLLARLVPRLAIADRAQVVGRFLEVRGNLRTYRIHLGSGNILMSPNDQYLCIVPKQAQEEKTGPVFLPFEGDRVLALILSKALLLAKDDQITDRSIVSQLRM
ncbi:DUF4132 domain-containing protein [Virgisporangium ochraceum]|uniref:DUF4132 domain-containing protein n=1 Tax=Virgisporangium ochraceum TaxID=65505 RepID=A0A8J4EGB9_9ACTN|nr:DUF4132 domain-containing protein [Virgisporangium ochraceum]GIJ70977.1 hypothetical protein Voc01_058940 [Virgisporangium ochraceum]